MRPDPSRLRRRAGLAGATVLAALAVLHVYWAAGGGRGATVVVPTVERGGTPSFTPTTAQAVGVAVALGTAAACYGVAATGAPPAWWARLGAGGAATVLLLRAIGDRRAVGFTKRRRGTTFATLDTLAFSPLCVVLAAAGAAVAAPRWATR